MTSIAKKSAFVGVATAASLAAIGGYVWMSESRPPILEIFIFPLKGGQATLIRTPDDHRVLINGGPNTEIVRYVSSVLPFYSRRIDAVVATDTSDKNVSGLIDIIERYSVDRVYVPAVTLQTFSIGTSTDRAYGSFLESVAKNNVESVELGFGDAIPAGDTRGVRIEVLFPERDPSVFEYSKASAPQMILKVSHGKRTVLLLNDATMKIQKHITASIGRVDALVVSHSASPAHISHELVSAASPKFLVYSRALTDGSRSNAQKGGKTAVDPLARILVGDRFNLRETGTVRIVISDSSLEINPWPGVW